MKSLYNFVDYTLREGTPLKEIKESSRLYLSSEVIDYCKEKSNYCASKYNRIKLYDYSNETFEMILICWDSNSETRIHDHPENGCVLHLIDGKLEEHLYDSNLEIKKITNLEKNESSYMDNKIGYHKIKCGERAMSLHIYSPPNHKMVIF